MPTNTLKAAGLLSANAHADAFELLGTPVEIGLASLTVATPSAFNLDDYPGYSWAGKPILGLDGVKAHIDSGTTLKAPNGVITYSFTDLSHLTGVYNNPNFGFTAGYGVNARAKWRRSDRAICQLPGPMTRQSRAA